MRVTLIHNSGSGDGETITEEIVVRLKSLGHVVEHFPGKGPKVAEAVAHPADLIAVAGGDGTVSRVLRQLPPSAPPLAILPLGTANNIAFSLGISGNWEALPEGWLHGRVGHLDIGTVSGADGLHSLVEGIGLGAFAGAMRKLDNITGPPKQQLARARKAILRAVSSKKTHPMAFEVDGGRLEVDAIFAEVTNISRIGPRINLVPSAKPDDGQAELVYALESQRDALVAWMKEKDEEMPPPLHCHRGRRITVLRAYKRLRVDDTLDVPSSALPLTLDMGARKASILLPR